MNKITAFIFDLDGVITDTSEFHYLAWQHLADDEGIPFSRDENEKLRGISRQESLQIMLKGRQISAETTDEWLVRKNQYYLELIKTITPMNLLPNALNLLTELKTANIPTAIASASKNTPMVLEKLGIIDLFDKVVDGNDPVRGKPQPDIFLLAAEKLGVNPKNCVVFEDAAAGIQGAKSAGMYSVALGPADRFVGADVIYPSLEGILLSDIFSVLESNS